jgi:O-antigen/teichoic acid export membrane protein
MVNLGVTALCGFGSVSFLTRLYSVQAVGLSAAAISAGGLIELITQFGLNYSLPRFLPSSPHRTDLINTVLTATMLATFVGSVIYLALPIATKMYALGGWLFVVLFLIGTTLDAGETNLEVVVVTDRLVNKLSGASLVANLVKLAAPATFLFLGMSGAYVSRVIYGVIGFAVLGIMYARRGHRFRPVLSAAATRNLRRFSAGSYFGNILSSLPQWIIPIVILSRFGSTQTAYWYTSMAIALLLYQIPGSVARILLVEVAHQRTQRRSLMRRAALVMSVITLPVFAAAYLAAPLVLTLFGQSYLTGSLATLRWLILAGMVSGVNYLTGTIIYLAKKTLVITFINFVDAVIVIGLAISWAHSTRDVAICWFIGEIPNTVLFALFAFRSLRQVGGKWEDLGGGPDEPVAEEGESHEEAAAAQQKALDVLLTIANLQASTQRAYDSGYIPIVWPEHYPHDRGIS